MAILFSIQLLEPKAKNMRFIVTTSIYQNWVIHAPAAFLDVEADSQAPSPEQNSNSLLPVNATVVQYTND